MTTYASPPPPLFTAIRSASTTYGVPEDLLTGIWHVESGSSYPNPYVNSIGYGGLFGTKNWYASTGAQANTAASILASLLNRDAGDISKALSEYSGGGYTSVPGETTFGTLSPGGTFGGTQNAPKSTSSDTSGGESSGGPSTEYCITHGCYLPFAGLFNSKCNDCPGRGNKQVKDAWDSTAHALGGIFTYVKDRLFRLGLILGGAILIVLSMTLLAREGATA